MRWKKVLADRAKVYAARVMYGEDDNVIGVFSTLTKAQRYLDSQGNHGLRVVDEWIVDDPDNERFVADTQGAGCVGKKS
jgi:hypothetical protein